MGQGSPVDSCMIDCTPLGSFSKQNNLTYYKALDSRHRSWHSCIIPFWLRGSDLYFCPVVGRQIKWVSCHENTPNNVINHELLRSQFLQTYNFPHLDISAATSQTSRKTTLWGYVYIRLNRQVSGLNHSKWLSISRLELHLVYWWHFPDRLKTELCQ